MDASWTYKNISGALFTYEFWMLKMQVQFIDKWLQPSVFTYTAVDKDMEWNYQSQATFEWLHLINDFMKDIPDTYWNVITYPGI